MNEKSLKVLEFNKIKSLLEKNAVSPQGRELAEKLVPAEDINTVKAYLAQTDEAFKIIESHGSSPIRAYGDVRGILARVKLKAVLSMKELLSTAQFLRAVREAKHGICDGEARRGEVYGIAELLVPFKDIEEEIFADIESEDAMYDSASPKLASLRRQIRNQNDSIKDKLNSLMRSLEHDDVLQEGIITIRNDRYVLPVIAANKSRVPGIVHDRSSSGATLFIEPMAVVEINNTIRQLKLDERDEMLRILEELSAHLAENYSALESDSAIMAQLDLIFAKARYSREIDGVCPKINDKGYIDIRSGRHPLIDKHAVVPITVWLGKEFTELMITGPNTGGKTVTLKTIGLFALMAQSGLYLPAYEGTEMPVFDNIFADIGDEQSIEQSLSTFSSHIKNIAEIMRGVTAHSLVLLDELGAGTDPAEGAALAMSILEELRRKRIRTAVTSHYAELKSYSLSHAGCENASVEFDVASLKPTYRVMVGVPGNSNAFLISSKLGLEKYLIDRARSYVDEDSRKLDKVLTNAEEYRASAQAKRTEAEQLRFEMNKERKKLEQEKHELERKTEKEILRAQEEARKIKENALNEANKIIEELKKLEHENDPSAIFKARQMRKQLESDEAPEKTIEIAGERIKEFAVGMAVRSEQLDMDGEVVSLPNQKGKVIVRFGAMQTEIDASSLVYPQKKAKKTVSSGVRVTRQNVSVPMSLDVRGQLADEAVANVDMYLDLALGANLGSVTVIHGKGTGALRSAINAYLRSNKHVKSFRLGAYGEGDAGVTVIELC